AHAGIPVIDFSNLRFRMEDDHPVPCLVVDRDPWHRSKPLHGEPAIFYVVLCTHAPFSIAPEVKFLSLGDLRSVGQRLYLGDSLHITAGDRPISTLNHARVLAANNRTSKGRDRRRGEALAAQTCRSRTHD